MIDESFLKFIYWLGNECNDCEVGEDVSEGIMLVKSSMNDLPNLVGDSVKTLRSKIAGGSNINVEVLRLTKLARFEKYSRWSPESTLKNTDISDVNPKDLYLEGGGNLFSEDFLKVIEDVKNFTRFDNIEFSNGLHDLGESLDILYESISSSINTSIANGDLRFDMVEWDSLVYLSKSLSYQKSMLYSMLNSPDVTSTTDKFDIESTLSIRELLSYGAILDDDVLVLDVDNFDNTPHLTIGSPRDDGLIISDSNNGIKIDSPINVVVSIVLTSNKISKRDLFSIDELVHVKDVGCVNGEGGYFRIKPSAIIDRLAVHRNGALVSVLDLLEI